MIQAIVFDWAGTLVDFGSRAPVLAFTQAFSELGIEVRESEVREDMGRPKREHLEKILLKPRICEQFNPSLLIQHPLLKERAIGPMGLDFNAHAWSEILYPIFVEQQLKVLSECSDPIPGVLDVLAVLREKKIRYGSTTGYTRTMMNVLLPEVEKKGLHMPTVVASDEVATGRPEPWMALRALAELRAFPIQNCIKVGDTPVDILEGKNAGMWTVGLVEQGNEVGLSQKDWEKLDPAEKAKHSRAAAKVLHEAGADFVIQNLSHLPDLFPVIEERILRASR